MAAIKASLAHRERVREVLDDLATPYWVRHLLNEVIEMDPVKVANVLEHLASLFSRYCAELAGVWFDEQEIIRRLVRVDADNGLLVDRITPEALSAVNQYLEGLVRKARVEQMDDRSSIGLAVALSAFTLGHDYRGSYGELPRGNRV